MTTPSLLGFSSSDVSFVVDELNWYTYEIYAPIVVAGTTVYADPTVAQPIANFFFALPI
jgi:hypothetical protein